uniref:Uncharacterized protein n=1 Tax=Oncorhynchus tshawytscha TaxID=74940 RepID=A0AAZ3PZ10_ONCTS
MAIDQLVTCVLNAFLLSSPLQVTNSMFSATRKRFVEGVESDYPDDTVYYGQTSMFPHPSDKDVSDATSMLQPLTPYYEVTDSSVVT